MDYEIIVVEPFLDYVKGEIISDPEKISELIDSDWQQHFIGTHTPCAPRCKDDRPKIVAGHGGTSASAAGFCPTPPYIQVN